VRAAFAVCESVLRDFKGLRRDLRVGGDKRPSLDHPVRMCREAKELISHGETKRFASTLKPLISLMEPNQPFRGIVSFQELRRRFVSLFSHFLSGADRATCHFQVRPAFILARSSEKGKLLSDFFVGLL
jgi:hypothetical protein